MCKKQTSVSHSSAGSEVLSLHSGLRMDGLPALDFWDIVTVVSHSTKDKTQPKHTSMQETDATLTKTQHGTRKTEGWPIERSGSRTHQHTFFSRRVSALHFWWQWSCDQNDNPRTKSHNETCVENSQSCSWLVVWQNQLGNQDPHLICWHQKPTCWHSEQRKFVKRWVESPSVFVQYHELSDTFWQPFQKFSFSSQRELGDWCHVETRTRHNLEWWLSSGKSQTQQSGDARSVQRGCLATKIGISGQSGK